MAGKKAMFNVKWLDNNN